MELPSKALPSAAAFCLWDSAVPLWMTAGPPSCQWRLTPCSATGPETVVSPDLVEHAYQAFQSFDWTTPELLDLQILFLRAARVSEGKGHTFESCRVRQSFQ
jgi:hypothetical protein